MEEREESVEINVAVVRGRCTSPAEFRTLPSGDVVAQLQVTAHVDGQALSVPVSVAAPPAWMEEVDNGAELVLVGTVRRRFFRAGGATASRVEIHADVIARGRDRRKLRALRSRLERALEAFDG